MHAKTTSPWYIPQSDYTTLQELVAAGGTASIELLRDQPDGLRRLQATCHVTTTRQNDLPDVKNALRADLLIAGYPLQQIECRAWLTDLVNAIQQYANHSAPLPPTAEAIPSGCCGQCQHDHQPLLIGIAGKARAGKSTAAHWLQQHGFDPLSFADPIKHMLRMLGLTDDYLAGDRKETIIPALGVSPRHMMQTLGTEWGRQLIHPNIWVMVAEAMLDGHDTVFTDVRFENEADMIRRRGGTILHIIREHPGIGSDHASESGIAIHDDDLVLHNNCELTGIGGMHAQLDAAVDLIRKRAHHCARQHPTPDSEAA